MKNYIVSESDLKEAIELYFDNRLNNVDKADLATAIITDLQPIELVVEGTIRHDIQQVDEEERELAGAYLECDEKKYWLNDVLPYEFLVKNENQNIKIYIQKVKE